MRNNIVDALAKRKCNWELFNLQTTMPNGGVQGKNGRMWSSGSYYSAVPLFYVIV